MPSRGARGVVLDSSVSDGPPVLLGDEWPLIDEPSPSGVGSIDPATLGGVDDASDVDPAASTI